MRFFALTFWLVSTSCILNTAIFDFNFHFYATKWQTIANKHRQCLCVCLFVCLLLFFFFFFSEFIYRIVSRTSMCKAIDIFLDIIQWTMWIEWAKCQRELRPVMKRRHYFALCHTWRSLLYKFSEYKSHNRFV